MYQETISMTESPMPVIIWATDTITIRHVRKRDVRKQEAMTITGMSACLITEMVPVPIIRKAIINIMGKSQ